MTNTQKYIYIYIPSPSVCEGCFHGDAGAAQWRAFSCPAVVLTWGQSRAATSACVSSLLSLLYVCVCVCRVQQWHTQTWIPLPPSRWPPWPSRTCSATWRRRTWALSRLTWTASRRWTDAATYVFFRPVVHKSSPAQRPGGQYHAWRLGCWDYMDEH